MIKIVTISVYRHYEGEAASYCIFTRRHCQHIHTRSSPSCSTASLVLSHININEITITFNVSQWRLGTAGDIVAEKLT